MLIENKILIIIVIDNLCFERYALQGIILVYE